MIYLSAGTNVETHPSHPFKAEGQSGFLLMSRENMMDVILQFAMRWEISSVFEEPL